MTEQKKPEAIDTPIDTSAWIPEEDAVLDLTEGRIVTGREAEFERAYLDFVERSAKEAGSPAGVKPVDTSTEDDEYRRFVEQSGMADFTGRQASEAGEPRGADMSESAGGDQAPETGNFFGAGEFLRMAAENAATDADLSEDGDRGDEALPREVREAEELNDALLRQAREDAFGPDESDGVSDDEVWSWYAKGIGQEEGR